MITKKHPHLRVHVRWLIQRDMPAVLAIEHANYQFPWTNEEFLRILRQRNCIGMVAEHGDKVVGFMVYSLTKRVIQVADFAVDPAFVRRGIGTQLLAKLKDNLSDLRRNRIASMVRESNLAGQLFLRSQSFLAVESIRDAYDDTHEDAIKFGYRLIPGFMPSSPVHSVYSA